MNQEIVHDESRRRFVWVIDGRESFVEYELPGTGTMIITTTYVPPADRKRGVAAALVEHALRWAEQHSMEVVPACSYALKFAQQSPAYGPLLSRDAARGSVVRFSKRGT